MICITCITCISYITGITGITGITDNLKNGKSLTHSLSDNFKSRDASASKKNSHFFFDSGEAPFVALLMGLEVPETHVMIYFHAISSSLTVLLMIASEIYVRFSQHGSQSISTNVSTTIINTVPFLTLNISMALTVFFGIIINIFGVSLVNTEPTLITLAAMLATNKMARKHLRLRFRQYMDSLTIGRTNRVEPVIAVALVPIREIRKEQL